jgi:hypothetical protein
MGRGGEATRSGDLAIGASGDRTYIARDGSSKSLLLGDERGGVGELPTLPRLPKSPKLKTREIVIVNGLYCGVRTACWCSGRAEILLPLAGSFNLINLSRDA